MFHRCLVLCDKYVVQYWYRSFLYWMTQFFVHVHCLPGRFISYWFVCSVRPVLHRADFRISAIYVIIMISFPNYLKPGWLEIYCKHFNRIISIIEFTIYFSTYMFQSSLFHLWNFPTPERTRNMTKNPQYRNVIISLNVWYTLIFTILQTHKDLVASDLIRQRVNTPTADVWFILQESRLTHIKLILDSRDFNQESLYYVMSKSEFLIIRSKQIKVFILTLTLFLFEYLVSEVKSAPYLFYPLKSIVSINRWNSVSHRKLILHLHLIYLS